MKMRELCRVGLGVLALTGCGAVESELDGASAPEDVQVSAQGLTTQTYTLSWPALSAGKNCRFGDTSLNHQAAINQQASGRKEETVTLSGMAGLRIASIKLTSSDPGFAYDDVLLLTYNSHLLMASDTRVATYSNNNTLPGTSPVSYVWGNIKSKSISNQASQAPWCAGGATGTSCTVPETEVAGALNVNISSFSAVDQAAYPVATRDRSFRLVTIGDNDDGSFNSGFQTTDTDCVHGPLSLTVTVSGDPVYSSCAAIKAADPSAPSGVYWIKAADGTPKRVYCDMPRGIELCREGVEQTIQTTTHEGSNLDITMRTLLLPSRNTCELWNLRRTSDGLPLSQLHAVAGNTLSTCQALGFQKDGKLGRCPYGSQYGDCGFTSAQDYSYGNLCSGCSVNEGSYNDYIRQGAIGTGIVITDVSGSIRTSCTVATTACDQDPANCGKSSSRPASGCAHLKAVNPSAPNGIYWVDSAQGAVQTYCKDGYELCSMVEGESVGIAPHAPNGAASMFYRMRSKLDVSTGICSMWAIRHAGDGRPLATLHQVGGNTLQTCQALGFLGDSQLGSCPYGLNQGTCGFSSASSYLYGNNCSGCAVGDGSYAGYVIQGPIYNVMVLSDMTGTVRTGCRAR